MNKDTRTTVLFIFFQIILIISAFILGVVITKNNGYAQSDFSVLSEAYDILVTNGLNNPPVDPALEYGMIHGMVEAYGDPFTSFVEPVQAELQTDQLAGKFGGIGSKIIQGTDGYYYLVPYPDSPASNAGILENDRLLAVDETRIDSTFTTDEIAALVRGPENSKVTLTISHSPDYIDQAKIIIKRTEVPLPSIEYYLAQNYPMIGILQINIIAESTPVELINAVEDLQMRGASFFILDLRNNGGGLLDAGIDLGRLFLHKTDIIIQKQSKNQDIETISAKKDGDLVDLNVLLLINGNTASAAEIFAGSLQANQRCKIFGQKSYGKNTIQLVFTLQDASSLHITSAEWWFPGLASFGLGNGLIPDREFPDIDSMDPAILDAAIQTLLDS